MSQFKLGDRVRIEGLELREDRKRGILLALVGFAGPTHAVVGVPNEGVCNIRAALGALAKELLITVELDQLVPDLEWDADQAGEVVDDGRGPIEQEIGGLAGVFAALQDIRKRVTKLEGRKGLVALEHKVNQHIKDTEEGFKAALKDFRELEDKVSQAVEETNESFEMVNKDHKAFSQQISKICDLLDSYNDRLAVIESPNDEFAQAVKAERAELKVVADRLGEQLNKLKAKIEDAPAGDKGLADILMVMEQGVKLTKMADKEIETIRAKYEAVKTRLAKDSLGDKPTNGSPEHSEHGQPVNGAEQVEFGGQTRDTGFRS